MEQLLDSLNRKGVDAAFSRLVKTLGLNAFAGVTNSRVQAVILDRQNPALQQLLKSFASSFQGVEDSLLKDSWFVGNLKKILDGSVETTVELSLIAEIEAFGHLKQQWPDTVQNAENGGKRGKTPDFTAATDLYVEVYCPDESHPEKKRVEKALEEQSGLVKTELSWPITGNGECARQYSTCKVIDKLLSAKRDNDQTQKNKKNVLWLDVKQKLKIHSVKALPLESYHYSNQTYINCFGLWHAFYGAKDKSVFPRERYSFKLKRSRPNGTYIQQKEGLFRERPYLSAAVISCLDGIILFENPWAKTPLLSEDRKRFSKMHQFRPEYSFLQSDSLEACIEHYLKSIELLLRRKNEPA